MPASSDDTINLERAQRLHSTGQYSHAEEIYRQLLAANPGDVSVIHLLGLLLFQQGRKDEGLPLIAQSVQMAPEAASLQFNYANALLDIGELDSAVAHYRKALSLQPDFPDALSNLSVALCKQGSFAEATTIARLVLARRPLSPEAVYNLALALRGQGDVAFARRDFSQAADYYRQAVTLLPYHIESNVGLARALAELKDPRAYDILNAAAHHKHTTQDAIYAYAQWLDRHGHQLKAIEQFHRVVAVNPNHAAAYADLAAVCAELGRTAEAVEAARKALDLQPDNAAAAANLGAALSLLGHHEEATNVLARFATQADALAGATRADALPPSAEPLSNYLLLQHYREPFDPEAVFLAHLEFGRRYDRPDPTPPPVDATPDRKLRIGYVSGDFRQHPVAMFMEPILQHHDPSAVEVFLYATRPERDQVTERLKQLNLHWRDISNEPDDKAFAMIRADRIDILVDLSGHTGGSRLPLFGRKPAPVQATYLGYPNTTGLRTIDFRITDAIADPPESSGGLYVEQLLRLPRPAWCYRPPPGAPDVAPPPVEKTGIITFGCFNAARKISTATARVWEKVLSAVPGSRLLLKAREFSDPAAGEQILRKLTDQGIDEQRIEIRPATATLESHLAAYNEIDIALDPIPYHGTTTTCDALYMGVPVITLAGRTHLSRVGVSLLTAVGLTDCIARNTSDYTQIARRLASDRRSLSDLRKNLRARLLASPLCDEPSMARALEELYREMWQRYLARPKPIPAASPAGDSPQAVALAMRKSLAGSMSAMIVTRHYDQDFDPLAVFELQRAFGREFDRPQPREFNVGHREKLRIGYVSPDFRRHAVASFIEPILTHHDHSRFDITCYSSVPIIDALTERLKPLADSWRPITHASDPQAAKLILDDQIDILIDLAGHSADNRLPLMGHCLAPVQMTYLGFPSSTGMSTINHRISDPHADPPGNERWHSESLIRLPSAFFCYRAHDEAPQITPLPALKSGHITFACLQTYPKITDRMLQIWSQILALSPQSRLLILAPADAEDRIRGALPFSDRVEIAPRLSLAKYYELFSRIDIALDTFPYNGHTTTCDCLWMGVPVVTLSGVAAVSRAGVSVLNNVGLPELIATSPEAYVSAAVSLAGDPNRLAELRATLRERMSQSPIMNGKLITQDLENAYTQMWAQRCGSR